MGNSQPRLKPPAVIGVILSGPGYLQAKVPEDAGSELFAYADGTVRQMQTWGKYFYFEQGHGGRDWMVANLSNRGPFHTSGAQRKLVEDLLIVLADAVLAGSRDLQGLLKQQASAYEVAPNQYDLGAAVIATTSPEYMRVTWSAPSKIPRFFEHLDVDLLTTSFAHDFGEMSRPVELKAFKLSGLNYYIDEPDSRTAEMGRPKDAHFRGLSFQLERKP